MKGTSNWSPEQTIPPIKRYLTHRFYKVCMQLTMNKSSTKIFTNIFFDW